MRTPEPDEDPIMSEADIEYLSDPANANPDEDPEEYQRKVKIVTCCGEELECPDFTNTCEICGADYNWAGQRLAPRSCWGEETGESASDILNCDYENFDWDQDY